MVSMTLITEPQKIKEYSRDIKETRRGSNAYRPHWKMVNSAYRSAERVISRPEVSPVLDIGCGLGYFIQACEENGITCYGIDLDHRQLSYARTRMKKHGINPKLYEEDARKLHFEDNSFGYVNCSGALMMMPYAEQKITGRILSKEETIEEVKKVLSEMKRVAKPGAEIRIVTFSEREEKEPTYYKATLDELRNLATEVGLAPLDVDYHRRWPNFIDALFKKN
jgi:SAM-dependent methyltransferase